MTEDVEVIEYRVKVVPRYVVTRYCQTAGENGEMKSGSETRGWYDNEIVAYEVAYALAKTEHEKLGYPLGDERIIYPQYPSGYPS